MLFPKINSFTSSNLNFHTEKKVSEETLSEKMKSILNLLCKASSLEEREKVLGMSADELLEQANNWQIQVNWQQFALMHAGKFVDTLYFKGGSLGDSIRFWVELLTLWKNGEGKVLPLSLTDNQMEQLQSTLEDYLTFYHLLPAFSNMNLTDEQVSAYGNTLQSALKSHFKTKTIAYVPLGYRQTLQNSGHVIPCKFIKTKNGVVAILLNQGEGNQNHPILDRTTTQNKVSFRYFPIFISDAHFYGSLGLTVLSRLIRLLSDRLGSCDVPYSSKDIYDLFLLWGELANFEEFDVPLLSTKSQNRPTCSEKGAKLVVHDFLVSQRCSLEHIKVFFLAARFVSILSGYHAFRQNYSKFSSKLISIELIKSRAFYLKSALEHLFITLSKNQISFFTESYPQLLGVRDKIISHVEELLTELPSVSKPLFTLSVNDRSTIFPVHCSEKDLSSPVISKTLEEKEEILPLFTPPVFSLLDASFLKALESWILHIECLVQQNLPLLTIQYLSLWFNSLPIPHPKGLDIWDEVPKENILPILTSFQKLIFLAFKDIPLHHFEEKHPEFLSQFLVMNTAYAIADKLARRLTETKLIGFASPFCLKELPIFNAHFIPLPFGEDHQRFVAIETYFQGQPKIHGTIFPWLSVFSLNEILKNAKEILLESEKKIPNSKISHFFYLKQFYEDAKAKGLPIQESEEKQFAALWVDKKHIYLPEAVHCLQYLAWASHSLVYGKQPLKEKIPYEIKSESNDNSEVLVKIDAFFIERVSSLSLENYDPRLNEWCEGRLSTNRLIFLSSKPPSINEGACSKKHDPYDSDLMRISSIPDLTISSALQWTLSHLHLLEDNDIRTFIWACFFKKSLLLNKLREEPEILIQLRELVSKGIASYGEPAKKLSAVLFYYRLGIGFETHAKTVFGKNFNFSQLQKYRKDLDNLIDSVQSPEKKASILCHQLVLYGVYETIPEIDIEHFLYNLFHFSLLKPHLSSHDFMIPRAQKVFLKFQEQIRIVLSFNETLQLFCDNLIRTLLPTIHLTEETWGGTYPRYSKGEYTLDFQKGKILSASGEFLNKAPEEIEKHPLFSLYNKKFPHSHFWKKDTQIVSSDNTLSFSKDVSEHAQFQIHLQVGDFEGWYEYVGRNHRIRHLFSDKRFLIFNYFTLLESLDSDSKHFLVFDSSKKTFPYSIAWTDQNMTISQLDKNGHPLPYQLANDDIFFFHAEPSFLQMQAILNKNRDYKNVNTWINVKERRIQQIEFVDLNLNFHAVFHLKSWKLESEEYPGYFLDPDQCIEELNGFSAGLVLKNMLGKKKIILFPLELSSTQQEFSTTVTPTSSMLFWNQNESDNSFKSYFIFSSDGEGKLKSSNPLANLYVSLLLKMQKHQGQKEPAYVTALYYLEQACSCKRWVKSQAHKIFNAFIKLNDFSPLSYAFNLHLIYHVFDNDCLLIKEQFDQQSQERRTNSTKNEKEFLEWSIECCTKYLLDRTSEHIYCIPSELKISYEREKFILSELLKRCEGTKLKTSFLKERLQLLCTEEQLTANIPPVLISALPSTYQKVTFKEDYPYLEKVINSESFFEDGFEKLPLPLHPIRITAYTLRQHFIPLYEQALKAPQGALAPIDFDLLTCLRESQASPFAHILFIVRHHSHDFTSGKFIFTDTMEKQEKISMFLSLSAHAFKILKKCYQNDFNLLIKSALKKKDVQFSYTADIHLPLFSSIDPVANQPWTIPDTLPFAPLSPHPLFNALFEELLFKQETPRDFKETPPFLDPLLKDTTPLEEHLVEESVKGYSLLKEKKPLIYCFKKEQPNQEEGKKLLKTLQNAIFETETWIKKQQMIIETLANETEWEHSGPLSLQKMLEAFQFKAQKNGHQVLHLTIQHPLIKAYVRKNSLALEQNNPFIKKNLNSLFLELTTYFLKTVEFQRMQSIFTLLETRLFPLEEDKERPPTTQALSEELGDLLSYELSYDIKKFPEFLVYEALSGKCLRKEQVKLVLWVIESFENEAKQSPQFFQARLAQFAAGGGKTSIMIPLLILRGLQDKDFPVFITSSAIYPVDKDNLNRTLIELGQRISFLEANLDMDFERNPFEQIYTQLQRYITEERALIITPEAYYALSLAYRYYALKKGDVTQITWLSRILFHIFKEKAFAMIDESPTNLSPLSKANLGVEIPIPIPVEERLLFLALFKPLLGTAKNAIYLDDGREVAKLLKLQENQQGKVHENNLKNIQKALACHMLNYPVLKISPQEKEEILHYWTDPSAQKPTCISSLEKHDKKRADLIVLTGRFILHIFPEILQMRSIIDHQRSPTQNEEFDVPCRRKRLSKNQFQDPYMTMGLSITGTFFRGLSFSQIKSLLGMLSEHHLQELQLCPPGQTTLSETLFQQWTGQEKMKLKDINLEKPKSLSQIASRLAKNEEAIEWYLTERILPQVTYTPELLSLTPSHLLNGMKRAFLTSATPGHDLLYSRRLDRKEGIQRDLAFEASVLCELCEKRNQQFFMTPTSQPKEFFAHLLKTEPSLFSTLRGFVDGGGLLGDSSNTDIAKAFIELVQESNHGLSFDGIVFFMEQDPESRNQTQDRIMVWLKNEEKPFQIEGDKIKEGLAEHGLKWENLTLFTFFDIAHSEAANLPLEEKATLLLSVGENLTRSMLIQSAMRMRCFLKGQKSHWIIHSELLPKIALGLNKTLSSQAIIHFCTQNEAKALEKSIIMEAFDEIAFAIEEKVNAKLFKAKEDPALQIEIMKRHANGFLQKVEHDPSKHFGDHPVLHTTREVLLLFAKETYGKYNFSEKYEQDVEIKKIVENIIVETEKFIKKIPNKQSARFGKEVHQRTHQKQYTHTQQKMMMGNSVDLKPEKEQPLPEKIVIYASTFLKDLRSLSRPAIKVFGTSGLSPTLFFTHNQLRTAQKDSRSLNENYLKPVDYLLVLTEENQRYSAFAISNYEASLFQKQLVNSFVLKGVHKAVLVNAKGELVQNGQGILQLSQEERSQLFSSQWFKHVIMDIALINGQLIYPDLFITRLASWHDFEGFWKKIVNSLANPKTANRMAIEHFMATIPKAPPEKKSLLSFLWS